MHTRSSFFAALLPALALLSCGSGSQQDDDAGTSPAAGGASLSGGASGSGAGGASGGAAPRSGGQPGSGGSTGGGAAESGGASTGGAAGANLILEPRNQHIASGDDHTCVIRADTGVECWGFFDGKLDVPKETGFAAVAAGFGQSCVLDLAGTATCWAMDAEVPSDAFSALAVGSYGCGVRKSDGGLVCWGGDSVNPQPPGLPSSGGFASVGVGVMHACALESSSQAIICWSQADQGSLAQAPAGAFVQLSVASAYSCGLTPEGHVSCWGDDVSGRLSPPLGSYQNVSAGPLAACGILSSGEVTCWGDPVLADAEAPAGPFVEIATGDEHVCGIREGGEVVCWGDSLYTVPEGLRALL